MSSALRGKLVDEIKKNTTKRLGGGYFTYGEYKLHKNRWSGELAQKLSKSIEGSSELQPFDSGSGKIGGSIFGSWEKLGGKLLRHLKKGTKSYKIISPTKKIR